MTIDPRLQRIKDKLYDRSVAEKTVKKQKIGKNNDQHNMNMGLRAGAELIASILGGGLIGYGLDQWLDTKPIFLIAMLVLALLMFGAQPRISVTK